MSSPGSTDTPPGGKPAAAASPPAKVGGVTALDFVTDAAAALAKLKAEIRADVIKTNVITGLAILAIVEYRAGRLGKLFGTRGGGEW